MPPQSSEVHYRRQARLAALASTQAAVAWESGSTDGLARSVAVLQYTAAADADSYLNTFDPEPAGTIRPLAFTGVAGDGRALLTLLQQAEARALLQIAAATAVQDAGRAAVSAGVTARRTLTGYVRVLQPPSCSRCTILAGKWFRWNTGFQRHPRCDCIHQPAGQSDGATTDPVKALRAGNVTGLSEANTKAILGGADMGRVVNSYGVLRSGQPRVLPGSRVMPESLYRLADGDRDRAVELLQQAGFITT